MGLHVLLLQLLIGIIFEVWSLPTGAPESVCHTMMPFHGGGILPTNSLPPFRIETATSVVGQGQTVRVKIVGVTNGLTFDGFMIQARNRHPPYEIMGQFNSSDHQSRLMNCGHDTANSATHTNTAPKTEVGLDWTAPKNFEGEILFNTTVTQTYDTFWLGINSEILRVVKRGAEVTAATAARSPHYSTMRTPYIPQYTPPKPTAAVENIFYSECGIGKNCFGFPDGCISEKNCDTIAAIKVRGNNYEFEMQSWAKDAAYVALGLSEDNKMGNDLVTECIPQTGHVMLYTSYTTAPPLKYTAGRSGVPQQNARLLNASVVDGVIYCRVERDIITRVNNKEFNLLNNKYYLLLATGTGLKENSVGYHDIARLPSDRPIYLAESLNLGAASTLLLRLHGCFMIMAWIGTTSVGIIFARYFKHTWMGRQLYGKDQWFVWHRLCMVTTWCLTMAACVIIFVEIGAWSSERNPHAILGLVTSILCFMQPIGALFRPSPNAPNRPLFNWAHWLGGNLAHLIAIVTIFFAVKLAKAQLPEWMDWILVAYVTFHVIVHLLYSIGGYAADNRRSKRISTFQMDDINHHHRGNSMKLERTIDAPFGAFRKGLLGLYIVILILFVAALVLLIALAPIEETLKNWQKKLN